MVEGTPLLRERRVYSLTEGSNPSLSANTGINRFSISARVKIAIMLQFHHYAPVAQLDRVLGYEPRGQEFESLPAHQ